MGFIRQPDPSAAKDAEIAALRQQITNLNHDLTQINIEHRRLQMQAVHEEDHCPECDDLCALAQEVEDSSCDLMKVQNKLKNDICGSKVIQKFNCKGLSQAHCHMVAIMEGLTCEREFALAIAMHNLAFCKGQGAPEHIDQHKAELQLIVAENPDIDPRCLETINEVLLLACA